MKVLPDARTDTTRELEDLRKKLEREMIALRLTDAEVKFYRAKEQILQMKRRMKGLKIRYRRAESGQNFLYQQSLRNRIITLKGVIFRYYDYTYHKADEIMKFREERFYLENEELIKSGMISEIRNLQSNFQEVRERNEDQPTLQSEEL